MKHVMWLMILLIPVLSFAQNDGQLKINDEGVNKNEIKPLKIGDKVPDLIFRNVLNYKKKTARLSEFKSKLIILDMWSVYCASCIAGFQKMEQLQNKFNGDLQILLVNPHDQVHDSKEKISASLEKLKARTGFSPSLPIPIHDSILNLYFPHRAVPHTIWIDAQRNLAAITGSEAVTEENIQRVLTGNTPKFAIKDDYAFDRSKPLLVEGNGAAQDNFIYRSVFTPFQDGIGFQDGNRQSDDGLIIGYFMINRPLIQYIMHAYPQFFNEIPLNRLIVESDNIEKYEDVTGQNTSFCYDLTISNAALKSKGFEAILREDLERTFNIRATKGVEKMKCLVVSVGSGAKIPVSQHKKQQINMLENSTHQLITRYAVGDVLKLLDIFDTPLIDNTSLTQLIDLEFPPHSSCKDKAVVVSALRQKGFQVTEAERVVEVIKIKDK